MSNGPVFSVNNIVFSDARIKKNTTLAQYMLDNQVIKDSNLFCPQDTGTLQGSALLASPIGQGKVVWNTPYARRLYYNPQYNFAKDKNPNARGLWFEAAKSANKDKWVELVKNIMKGGQ